MQPWLKWTLIVFVILLPLEALTGVWFWATGAVTGQTQAWIAARRSEGWTVASGEAQREGWPFEARIRLPQASITNPAQPSQPSTRLEAEAATVGVKLWALHTLIVGLHGEQRVTPPGGRVVPFATSRTELVLPLTEGQPPDYFDLALDDLAFSPAQAPIKVAGIRAHGDLRPGHSAGSLLVTGIDLPTGPAVNPLGARIDRLGIDATMDGPAYVSPAAWKAAGGALHLTQLTLAWGKLGVLAHGELHLDDQLQPEGSLTAGVTGAADTLDALVAARLVQPNAATATRALLTLMQKPGSDGRMMAEFPFTLKNQRLQMGQFPITRVPDIRW